MLWESTAVSNVFLCEFMPSAPDLYVKIYLLCLMYAHTPMGEGAGLVLDVARTLGVEEGEVEKALAYWERVRLLERISTEPPKYRFISPSLVMIDRNELPEDTEYEHFGQALHAKFENKKRKLHGGEVATAYEWVEQMKLPQDVVLLLVQHMLDNHGVNFKFKDAEKTALLLCEKKIDNITAAEEFLAGLSSAHKGVKSILA